ncbi:MAG TPA: flagellar hook-basal body complex protein FliE, partial [Kineosporiaceae bacterium]|nr:flagellar hook-basal body complex protein FliE [Kineosporiaceae bacterium]
SVGGVAGAGLSQLAQLYRQQVLSGNAAAATGGTGQVAAGGSVPAAAGADPAAAARGSDFAAAIGNGLNGLEQLDKSTSSLATRAATGDLKDVQDYVITAMQAQTATELTTTVRNKALDAFNEIMRMPL